MADMETTIGVDFYLSEIDVNGKKIKVEREEGGELLSRKLSCVRERERLPT